jgi:lipopolysaccharide export system permease protein
LRRAGRVPNLRLRSKASRRSVGRRAIGKFGSQTVFGTLSRYMGRQFLWSFAVLMAILIGVITLFEFIEMTRRAGEAPDAGLLIALELTVLKLPQTVELLFHFAVLFAAIYTFWRLTRNQELVVARAAGVSAWQFLLPIVAVAAAIGFVKILVVNPFGAAMVSRYDEISDRHLHGRTQILEIAAGSLWLRQETEGGSAIIHADRVQPDAFVLEDVTVFLFAGTGAEAYGGRLDARTAALEDGYWDMREVRVSLRDRQSRTLPAYRLTTDLTVETIADSFASPQSLSFWELPGFIETLQETGFPSVRHRLHYQSLLTQPLLFAAMVMFGAAFSLRHTRRGGTLLMIGGGVTTGFVLFVTIDVMTALGVAESVPIPLAAWTPALLSLFIGAALLLHFEDG